MTVSVANDTNGNVPIEQINPKLPGRVGVLRIFTWEELKELINAGRLELLGRVAKEEEIYRKDMSAIREKHGSVVNYILNVKLADFIRDTESEYLMVPNDYPYALPENTKHFIVWSKQSMSPGTVPDPPVGAFFKSRLAEIYHGNNYEYVWFVNPPELQSIPEVIHGHLIVREL